MKDLLGLSLHSLEIRRQAILVLYGKEERMNRVFAYRAFGPYRISAGNCQATCHQVSFHVSGGSGGPGGSGGSGLDLRGLDLRHLMSDPYPFKTFHHPQGYIVMAYLYKSAGQHPADAHRNMVRTAEAQRESLVCILPNAVISVQPFQALPSALPRTLFKGSSRVTTSTAPC